MMITSESIFGVFTLFHLRLHSIYKEHTLRVDISAIRSQLEGILFINDRLAILALFD